MKTSNKILLVLFLVIFTAITAVIITVRSEFHSSFVRDSELIGNSAMSDKQFNVTSFNKLSVTGNIRVRFSQDKNRNIKVRTYDKILNYIAVEVKNEELLIYLKGEIRIKQPVEVEVSADSLNRVTLRSGCSFESAGALKVPKLDVEIHDGSVISANGIFKDFSLIITDGSVSNISGECDSAVMECKDGSVVNAEKLIVQNATVTCKDGSNVHINVQKYLSVSVRDGSNVTYRGNPEMRNIEISDGGNLKKAQ